MHDVEAEDFFPGKRLGLSLSTMLLNYTPNFALPGTVEEIYYNSRVNVPSFVTQDRWVGTCMHNWVS